MSCHSRLCRGLRSPVADVIHAGDQCRPRNKALCFHLLVHCCIPISIYISHIQVEYSKIKEIRSAPRAFGLWGEF